ncbi:tRNA lysidine(34) synthetase TilS [candidate division WOR-1 bacterium RIFOXYA12_FULL_43_27]|nr:MAG: tRNA lysidine(34) synthetase TilS [candidate division WOR-1 bacterium RIFOXYA12_FULL_43_27]OGC18887.1 MAG: tRNA lysidine(34) synthetase TilS [candidate division WOR-1 bacterium RIFOXYB2_FULL_46_45]OGC29028.1 MAG: tRNA lysidine(34) synthetase TilS [candidate division WOR-1 bacterium RIFOXYA2_FULL_46_56]
MLKERFLQTIKEYKMIKPKDIVLAGVSGGADSVSLLHLLNEAKEELDFTLYVAHLNHLLRPDAEIDQRFVEGLSKNLGLTCISDSVNVAAYAETEKMNIENAARKLRYEFYRNTAQKIGANKIALGHNADDNVETFLMHLLRGAGLKGLTGIPPVRKNIVRPLIKIWRRDIDKYIATLKLVPRIDHTNYESKYLRNRVRLKLIPQLKIYNLNIKDILLQTILLLTEDSLYLEREVKQALQEIITRQSDYELELNLEKLRALDPPVQGHFIRAAIERVKGNLSELAFSHIHDILKNLYSNESWELNLPEKIFVIGTRSKLTITKEKPPLPQKISFRYKLPIPGKVLIEEIGMEIMAEIESKKSFQETEPSADTVYVDFDEAGKELLVRSRRDGDRFYPLGMKGAKKLQDFFVDNKINKEDRDRIPIVEAEGRIIWVAGLRIDERVKVTRKTSKVIKLHANHRNP